MSIVHLPDHFAETDLPTLHALIDAQPLATWATLAEGELLVNLVPFLLDRERGPLGTLVGHVARANAVWRVCSRSVASVLTFHGPQAYITPSWYAAKREHGKVVPTWNYAAVQARGVPRVIEDRAWLRGLVERLTARHEASEARPWQVSDAPADYIDTMLGAIVGVEIPIERLTGKWKASQNRPAADRRGVVEGLRARGDAQSLAVAALVKRTDAPG